LNDATTALVIAFPGKANISRNPAKQGLRGNIKHRPFLIWFQAVLIAIKKVLDVNRGLAVTGCDVGGLSDLQSRDRYHFPG